MSKLRLCNLVANKARYHARILVTTGKKCSCRGNSQYICKQKGSE